MSTSSYVRWPSTSGAPSVTATWPSCSGSCAPYDWDGAIASAESPERKRTLAMIVARILDPASKLSTARGFDEANARDSLTETLALGETDEDVLYAAMDWLLERQDTIERRPARRHLKDGALVFYDLTSVYKETRHKQGVRPQLLTLHSNRGAPMTSKCTAHLLANIGVTRSLNGPQVSEYDPFSEPQFKTLKYHPAFPGRPHTKVSLPARSGLGQSTRDMHHRINCSVDLIRQCLKVVDRFRTTCCLE